METIASAKSAKSAPTRMLQDIAAKLAADKDATFVVSFLFKFEAGISIFHEAMGSALLRYDNKYGSRAIYIHAFQTSSVLDVIICLPDERKQAFFVELSAECRRTRWSWHKQYACAKEADIAIASGCGREPPVHLGYVALEIKA
jgi:hypothetical protein